MSTASLQLPVNIKESCGDAENHKLHALGTLEDEEEDKGREATVNPETNSTSRTHRTAVHELLPASKTQECPRP